MSKFLVKTFSLIFIITVFIRLIDVIKNLFIASKIGVSNSSDIYLSLIVIPDSILVLIGFDTIKGVVNSEYSSIDTESDYLKNSFKSIFTYLVIGSSILVFLLLFFRLEVISILLPGFTTEKKDIALSLSLIIFPILFFKGINSLFQAFYNSSQSFYYPVITQISITFFIVLFIFAPALNNSLIYNISVGLLIGTFCYTMFLLIPVVKKFGINLFNFKIDNLTKKIFKSCFSLIVLVIFNQIYLFSRNWICSFFPEGSLSALNYASSVTVFISTLTFNTVFSVLLSSLSKNFSFGTRIRAKRDFMNTLILLFYLYIPVVTIFVLFNREILTLLFLRGNFNTDGIELTSKPFIWESLSLIPFLFSIIPTALFLAKKEYKKFTLIGVFVYSSGILINFLLSNLLGFYGVSVGAFVVYSLLAILLFIYSRKYLGRLNEYKAILLKLVFSGSITFFSIYLIKVVWINKSFIDTSFVNILLNLIIGSVSVGVLYYALTHVMKVNLIFKLSNLFSKEAANNES